MSLTSKILLAGAALALASMPASASDDPAPPDRATPPIQAPPGTDGKDAMPTGWQTWTWRGNCFAIDYAKGPSMAGVQNGDTYIAVKHIPREHNYDAVSVVSGFGDITGTQGTLEVGGEEFPLLVYGNAGFVRSGDPEHKVMDLLSKSRDATVTWYRKDGMAVQTYDVSDFAAAKRTIDVGCPHPAAAPGDKQASAEAVKSAAPAKRRKGR